LKKKSQEEEKIKNTRKKVNKINLEIINIPKNYK
jgi:hypothetical protein